MASVTIIDYDVPSGTSTSYTADFNSLSAAYQVNTTAPPRANGGSIVQVQNQTYANPTYGLSGAVITERSGGLTYDKLREWATRQYDPDDKYLLLRVDYGYGSEAILPDSAGGTDGIRVVLSGFQANMGLRRYEDTDKMVSTASINFVETV